MIKIDKLKKNFGSLTVLDNLSFTIKSGSLTYLVGPNGAGKTTLIKIILGLIRKYSGDVYINDELISGKYEYKSQLGYMPQNPNFPENLTVSNIFKMVKDLRDRHSGLDEELISSFNLESEMNKRLKNLSGGTLQKVNASIAFLFDPALMILDEPTAGLDPVSSSILKDKILKENAKGKTVLFTSHIISELEDLAQQITFIMDGKSYFQGTLSELIKKTGEKNLERSIASIMLREKNESNS